MSFTPIDPDSPENPENSEPDSLQEQLRRYQEAIKQEWEDNNGKPGEKLALTPEKVREKARDLLVDAVPAAIAQVIYLSEHADSENLQFKAATYIIDKATDQSGLVSDPLENLFKQLTNDSA